MAVAKDYSLERGEESQKKKKKTHRLIHIYASKVAHLVHRYYTVDINAFLVHFVKGFQPLPNQPARVLDDFRNSENASSTVR